MKSPIAALITLSLLGTVSAWAAHHQGAAKPTAAELATGKQIYEKSCMACHTSGVMGAPKTGDKAAWKGHIADGADHMVKNAIKGIGKMPAKGGNAKLTDAEVKAAVLYMIEQSK